MIIAGNFLLIAYLVFVRFFLSASSAALVNDGIQTVDQILNVLASFILKGSFWLVAWTSLALLVQISKFQTQGFNISLQKKKAADFVKNKGCVISNTNVWNEHEFGWL